MLVVEEAVLVLMCLLLVVMVMVMVVGCLYPCGPRSPPLAWAGCQCDCLTLPLPGGSPMTSLPADPDCRGGGEIFHPGEVVVLCFSPLTGGAPPVQ